MEKKQLYCTCAPWAQCWPLERAAIGVLQKSFFSSVPLVRVSVPLSRLGTWLLVFCTTSRVVVSRGMPEAIACLFLRKGTAYISRSAGWPAYSVCMFRTGLRYSQLSTERKCKVRGRFVERHLGTRNHHVLDGKTGRIAAGERERSYGFLVDDQENFGRSRHWSLLPGGRCCLSGALDQSKKRPSQRPTRVGNGGPTETVAQRKEQRRSRGISGEAREGGKGKINGLL
ncbi:hypothetical protein BDP67DRAFT_509957 [Colletotrichum lupini]|nr:hypothetical protein BDP67DRAFT_509957 [Colletotrichum lupini]